MVGDKILEEANYKIINAKLGQPLKFPSKKKADLEMDMKKKWSEVNTKCNNLQRKNYELEESLRKFQQKIIDLNEEKSNLTYELNKCKIIEDSLQKSNDLLNKKYATQQIAVL